MTFDDIERAAQAVHLRPLGGLQKNERTLVLFGPLEPGFWDYVTHQPEFLKSQSDPLDQWSRWAMTELGRILGADPHFPFGGPPYAPFFSWALEAGIAFQSPVNLLVSAEAGLLISFRGALEFDRLIDLPQPPPNPCVTCVDQPCRSACPAGALTPNGYDVSRCKDRIDMDPVCARGCRARLSCPASQTYGRHPDQTAFHMAAFHSTEVIER